MKTIKLKLFTVLSIGVLCFTSCGNKQKKEQTREDMIEEFRAELTLEDTTQMLTLCDNLMEQLKAKNYSEVLGSLYLYDDSTHEVSALSENIQKRYERKFKMFPVLDYKRQYYSFMLEGCNDVKYEVTFATAEQTGTGEPATTMFMFNPVKIDGEWKVCLKNPEDETDPERE